MRPGRPPSADVLALRLEPAAPRSEHPPPKLSRHALCYDDRDRPLAFGSRDEGALWVDLPGLATFQLPAGDTGLIPFTDERADAGDVLDAYYGTALPFALQATRSLEVLHASGAFVLGGDSAVAFCGRSGSGKSTIAYALALRGYGYWGDDAVAFRVDGAQRVTAVGLPFIAKLRRSSAGYFGVPAEPSDLVDDFVASSARLAAVFLLEPIDSQGARARVDIHRLHPGDALHALLPNAYRFQPETDERRRETMRAYLELVASVPILGTRFPRRVERLPDLLDELEERISALA